MTARRKDPLRSGSPAFVKRQEIWRHNGFFGHARMMQMQARAIMNSRTASTAAKHFALRIEGLAMQLAEALKVRQS